MTLLSAKARAVDQSSTVLTEASGNSEETSVGVRGCVRVLEEGLAPIVAPLTAPQQSPADLLMPPGGVGARAYKFPTGVSEAPAGVRSALFGVVSTPTRGPVVL